MHHYRSAAVYTGYYNLIDIQYRLAESFARSFSISLSAGCSQRVCSPPDSTGGKREMSEREARIFFQLYPRHPHYIAFIINIL